jgi:hypothetical protein
VSRNERYGVMTRWVKTSAKTLHENMHLESSGMASLNGLLWIIREVGLSFKGQK